MSKIMLKTNHGKITIHNLNSTWIQPLTMSPGYMLCYEDDIYKRGTIYRSTDKQLLMRLQDKLMDAYNEGKKKIKL